MYLSGGNATTNASLSPARNYVIWLARLGSPGYTGILVSYWKLAICHYERNHSAQKHLRPFNQNDDSRRDDKRERLKGTMEGQNLMLTLAAIAMRTHNRSLALNHKTIYCTNEQSYSEHYNCCYYSHRTWQLLLLTWMKKEAIFNLKVHNPMGLSSCYNNVISVLGWLL